MRMSSVTVFVFLLDNLSGFNNALNETLINNAKYSLSNESPVIENCDFSTTDQILRAVSQDLDLILVPTFRHDDNQIDKEQSLEVFDPVFDSSLHEAENVLDKSLEKTSLEDSNDYSAFYRRNNDKNEKENTKEDVKNETKIDFPKTASFMVAIFETLSNITAQTCAGTLLSPRWVLTAANCVNLLSNLYANNTNITDATHYTIVAGSSNPLLDGTAHNVTTVLMHPELDSTRRTIDLVGPFLALMRIEPEIETPVMELMAEEVKSGDVMVYGWIFSRSESDHESLNCTSMSATVLSSAECQAMYSYRDNDVLCLFNNDMDKNTTQLSSGGPVLIVNDKKVKMLAVVQTDEHVFVSYPLATHYSWINETIHNKLELS